MTAENPTQQGLPWNFNAKGQYVGVQGSEPAIEESNAHIAPDKTASQFLAPTTNYSQIPRSSSWTSWIDHSSPRD